MEEGRDAGSRGMLDIGSVVEIEVAHRPAWIRGSSVNTGGSIIHSAV